MQSEKCQIKKGLPGKKRSKPADWQRWEGSFRSMDLDYKSSFQESQGAVAKSRLKMWYQAREKVNNEMPESCLHYYVLNSVQISWLERSLIRLKVNGSRPLAPAILASISTSLLMSV